MLKRLINIINITKPDMITKILVINLHIQGKNIVK